MTGTEAIARYENLLMKRIPRFYLNGSATNKENCAIAILKYIVSDLLEWTPKEAITGLNPHVIKQLHIDTLFSYINFPSDINPMEDYDYLMYIAFPGEVIYDPEDKIIRNYKAVLNGNRDRFPKNYFNRASGGRARARCCLAYAIDNNIIIKGQVEDSLYSLFADKAQIYNLLKLWKLNNVCKILYNNEPLDFLHDTLEETPAGEFLYYNHLFTKMLSENKSSSRKHKGISNFKVNRA